MPDNETPTPAIEILNDILAEAEQHPDTPYLVHRGDDATSVVFHFVGADKYGKGGIILSLYPNALAEWVYAECDKALDPLLGRLEVRASTPEQRGDMLKEFCRITLDMFLKGVQPKAAYAFMELRDEAQIVSSQIFLKLTSEGLREGGMELPEVQGMKDELKDVLAHMAKERKDYLTQSLERYSIEPQLDRLGEFYNGLLPVWQDARKIYKENKERDTWPSMVSAKYPEITFDRYLLMRLTGRLGDLPEDVQQKVAEKGGDSTPATIALEHAARMCGARPYQYTIGYLYQVQRGRNKNDNSKS